MRDEKEERKKEASKVKQTNKAKQHSTPKAVTFPRKNELPQVGLEPTILYTLDRALYQQCTYTNVPVLHLAAGNHHLSDPEPCHSPVGCVHV